MKSTLKIALALVSSLSLAQSSRPAAAAACAGVFCSSTTILRLYPASDTNDPRVYVQPADGGQQALQCTPVSGIYLTLKASHPLFKEIYSTLLQATVNNRRVDFRVLAGSADCEIAYVVLPNP
jgi:hypothetical protein